MRLAAARLLAVAALLYAIPAAAAPPTWQPVAKVGGIFDVGGPRKDGWLVVAGSDGLFLVDPAGAVTPFAQGPGGYADDRGAKAYLAVSPGLHPGGAGCDFQAGDVYILRLHAPLHLAFKVDNPVQARPNPSPTVSPSPGSKRAPESPAAILAIIVTLAVLGAGALAVVRGRWGSPGSGSAPPSR